MVNDKVNNNLAVTTLQRAYEFVLWAQGMESIKARVRQAVQWLNALPDAPASDQNGLVLQAIAKFNLPE